MFWFIVVLVVMGLVIGALARLLVPGKNSMGILATMGVGVVGTLLSGFIGRAIFGADGRFGSWIFALVITVGLVILVERIGIGRSKTS